VYPAAVNKPEIESPQQSAGLLLRVGFFVGLALVALIFYRQ
jgi:hypothetical protein